MANPKRTGYSLVDGDTLKLNRSLNGNPYVRLAGYDTPPLNTRAGQIAKQQLKQELHGKPITLETVGKSYGRNVAIVRVAGRNVNNAMKRRGY